MLIKIFIIVAISGCLSCASANWSREDTYRQVAMTTVMSVDYLQTMKIARNPNQYHENNPILGKHPSEEKVTGYFIGSYIVTSGVSLALLPEYRSWWQYVIIGVEGTAVANNFSIGLGFGF